MKNAFSAVIAAVFISLFPLSAEAASRIRVPDSTFEDSAYTVNISNGHNTVIQLSNGLFISSVWIDDPSILGVATDRPLCEDGSNSNNCGFVQLIRLTAINGVDIPGQSFSTSGGRITLLNLIVTDRNGNNRQLYQFEVKLAGSSNGVSVISIVPDGTRGVARENLTLPNRLRILSGNLIPLRNGMAAAIAVGRADESSDAWANLLKFIELMESGDITVVEAIRESQVSTRLIATLEEMSSSELSVI